MVAQGGEDVVDATAVEFLAALFAPLVGEVGAGTEDGLGGLEQMLLGVPDVDDLDGAGEVLFGEVPDPGGAVAEHDLLLSGIEARAARLRAATRRAKGG